MHHHPLALILALACLLSVALPPAAPAIAGGCRYTLGFKALHDVIPTIVGDCLVDEYHDSGSGDALQQTTGANGNGGLLVWRKADNWTAYTDGYRTWISGPNGLQSRLNTERFAWEKGSRSYPQPGGPRGACELTVDNVSDVRSTRRPDGSWTYEGTLVNNCDRPINATVDVFGASVGVQVAADSPTIFVTDLPPGGSQRFSAFLPGKPGISFTPNLQVVTGLSSQASALGKWCSDAGGQRCLLVDPWLTNAVYTLNLLPEGHELLQLASGTGVVITRKPLEGGVLGLYNRGTQIVSIAQRLDGYSVWVRTAVLAHEMQHAINAQNPGLLGRGEQCYQNEEAAQRRGARIWAQLWDSGQSPEYDRLHVDLNYRALTFARSPDLLRQYVREKYESDCRP